MADDMATDLSGKVLTGECCYGKRRESLLVCLFFRLRTFNSFTLRHRTVHSHDSHSLSLLRVHSVLGPVAPEELGITLTHEHLLIQYTKSFTMPGYISDISDLELKMENLGRIRQYP